MIPSTSGFLENEFEITEQPSKTFKLDKDKNYVRGVTDQLEAVKQAIYMVLNTERYRYPVLTWNYGVEFMDLYGEPVSYVCPELERRITEALTWDMRITGVTGFEFDTGLRGSVQVNFTVHTIYGDVRVEKAVDI